MGSGDLSGPLSFPVRLAEIYRFDLGGGVPDWTRSMIVLGDHGPCTDRSPDGGNTTVDPDGGRGGITFARWDTQYLFISLGPSLQLDAGVYSANGVVRGWYLPTDAGPSSPFYVGATGAAGIVTSNAIGLDAVGTVDVLLNHSDGGHSTLRGTYAAHFCGFF